MGSSSLLPSPRTPCQIRAKSPVGSGSFLASVSLLSGLVLQTVCRAPPRQNWSIYTHPSQGRRCKGVTGLREKVSMGLESSQRARVQALHVETLVPSQQPTDSWALSGEVQMLEKKKGMEKKEEERRRRWKRKRMRREEEDEEEKKKEKKKNRKCKWKMKMSQFCPDCQSPISIFYVADICITQNF